MKKQIKRSGLMVTTSFCSAVVTSLLVPTLFGGVAQAQEKKADEPKEVVVTGSIIRKKNFTSISPLTTISSSDLEKRGVTAVESALQSVSVNNGGAISNNWTIAGFSAGASGLSLRGLTSDSTLVLIDGMRMAYYPLADDGTRNFVDVNGIADATIDKVDVLQDGASATYGADAIAGVVNVITKKQFAGFSGRVTVGAPETHGGAGQKGFAATWGKGNLVSDGYNFYLSAEYQKDDTLLAKDAKFPYNTADQSSYCGNSVLQSSKWSSDTGVIAGTNTGVNAAGITCRTNSIANGVQFNDRITGLGATTVAMVRPYTATGASIAGSLWQLANPALECGSLPTLTVTANQLRNAVAGLAAGTKLCQMDAVKLYNTIQPEDTRKSVSAHLTKVFNDTTTGYISGNFYQNETLTTGRGGPRSINSTTTPGAAGTTANLGTLNGGVGMMLPIYVCPRGTTAACTVSNGTLNPNNPFAAAGNKARISYLFGDIPYFYTTDSKSFRVAGGLKGVAFGWDYNLDVVLSKVKLTRHWNGVPNIQHILDVVADGSYNFLDPSKNSQAVRDYVAPMATQISDSELDQAQLIASKSLMDLPGGPLTLGLGASLRYERIHNPSANPDILGANSADRYSNAINPFGATGFRTIWAVNFEADFPITTKWDVNAAGRWDYYSTGFNHFSPKIASSYKLFDSLTFRGSYSKGFRAPSISETSADPTTGFVTLNAPSSFVLATHNNDGYGASYSLGKTTVASKDLRPETSEGTSLGIIWQPTKSIGFSADYYLITKKDVIAPGEYLPGIVAYFAGQPIPPSLKVIPGTPDPLLPNALPVPGFVQYQRLNLNRQDVAGYDFSTFAKFNFGPVKYTSSLEATYIQYYTETLETGAKQRFDGTLGNNDIASGSGTPKWKGNWQNTFDFGKASVTATVFYVSGYKAIAMDSGDKDYYGACDSADNSATPAFYRDNATAVKCKIGGFAYANLHGSYQITKNYSVSVDAINAFNAKAPYDPSGTYGITLYNPAFTSAGMMGRYWKVTGKVTF